MNTDQIYNEYYSYIFHFRKLSNQSIKSYCADVKDFLKYLNISGELDFKKIDYEILENYINYLKEKISANSINRKIASLKSFCQYLFLKEYTTADISLRLEKLQYTRQKHIYYSEEQLFKLFDTLKYDTAINFRNSLMIMLFYTTGIRLNELTNLTLDRVNLEQKILLIHGKGNKERFVPLNDFIIDLIKEFKEKHYAYFNRKILNNHLFLNYQGKSLSRTTISAIILKIVQESKLNLNITAHSFRHLCATHLLENGTLIEDVQKLLGHEHISTTEIYLTISPIYVREKYYAYHFIK